jgi:hypothetical protein
MKKKNRRKPMKKQRKKKKKKKKENQSSASNYANGPTQFSECQLNHLKVRNRPGSESLVC